MTQPLPRLAILGLGTMGMAMAATALRAGLPLTVWNRRPGAAADFSGRPVTVAGSVTEAVEDADVVITMVTDAEAVLSIARDGGLLPALKPGAVWAQMSTIGVDATESIAGMATEQRPDTYFVDSPVSGSRVPAEQGGLLIFASGPDEARPRVAPVFEALGHRTLWLGPAGYGSRMKLVNNVLLAFTAEGVANSIAIAQRLGLHDGYRDRRLRWRSAGLSVGIWQVPPDRPGRVRRGVCPGAGAQGRRSGPLRRRFRPIRGAGRAGEGVGRDRGPRHGPRRCHDRHSRPRGLSPAGAGRRAPELPLPAGFDALATPEVSEWPKKSATPWATASKCPV